MYLKRISKIATHSNKFILVDDHEQIDGPLEEKKFRGNNKNEAEGKLSTFNWRKLAWVHGEICFSFFFFFWVGRAEEVLGCDHVPSQSHNHNLNFMNYFEDVLISKCMYSILTSAISSDGTWGRKSFPTNRHMKTKSSINRSRSPFMDGSGILRLSSRYSLSTHTLRNWNRKTR